MTEDEIEKKARAEYEATRERGDSPWSDLPEFRRAVWRDLFQGNAGAAVD